MSDDMCNCSCGCTINLWWDEEDICGYCEMGLHVENDFDDGYYAEVW